MSWRLWITMKNLAGCKFGEWTVITEAPRKSGKRHWWCECSCGTIREVSQSNLVSEKSSRCRVCSGKLSRTKHGQSHKTSGIYSVWKNMKVRCLNPNHKSYENYGGRGVKICDKWLNFEGFYEDMGSTYESGLTLDRVDNSGNYCLENCRWATRSEQNSNTRRNVILEYKGGLYTEAQLSRLTGVHRTTITARRKRGLIGESLVNGLRKV